jgi:hypothetical protein
MFVLFAAACSYLGLKDRIDINGHFGSIVERMALESGSLGEKTKQRRGQTAGSQEVDWIAVATDSRNTYC